MDPDLALQDKGTLTVYGLLFLGQIISGLISNRTAKKEARKTREFTDMRVRSLNGIAMAIVHSLPGPCWLKVAETVNGVTNFKMLEMNEEYAKQFHRDRTETIGRTDLEAGWPKEIADKFRQNDLLVWASGERMIVDEPIDLQGNTRRFVKIRLQSSDGMVKGVMGYCADAAQFCDPERCLHIKKNKPA